MSVFCITGIIGFLLLDFVPPFQTHHPFWGRGLPRHALAIQRVRTVSCRTRFLDFQERIQLNGFSLLLWRQVGAKERNRWLWVLLQLCLLQTSLLQPASCLQQAFSLRSARLKCKSVALGCMPLQSSAPHARQVLALLRTEEQV